MEINRKKGEEEKRNEEKVEDRRGFV